LAAARSDSTPPQFLERAFSFGGFMQQISEHVYGILTRGQFLNMYLIVNGDNLALIDTAMGEGDINTVEKELAQKGWNLSNIKHVLITHAHPDHIGGLAALQKRVNVHTYVHRLDASVVRGASPQVTAPLNELNFFWRMIAPQMANMKMPPARVDTEFQDGDELSDVLEGLKVVHLPGHSYGHSAFWLEKEGVLIAGDVMMNFPWGLSFPIRAPSPDWAGVKASVRKVAALNPPILGLGHGKVVRGGIREKIEKAKLTT
jgi:glyoxylase-like metal-dependent hydrolase (beta-lactamase superfamily II)